MRFSGWKANSEVASIESRLSDTRLFGLIQLINTIPFPQVNQTENKGGQEEVHLFLHFN